jgi:glutathione gamma-glutamylcysteinyltransferase
MPAAPCRSPGAHHLPMMETLYRRPLPADAVTFSSREGRQLFAEALAAGGLDGYFPLAEQFHTQSDPSFCGLGSLVVALNALAIDPGRLWKGPWRWFAEDLLDCCVPLPEVRKRGLDIDELSCLARCNGAEVQLVRADAADMGAWRAAMTAAARGDSVVIASYDRSALGQTGAGHFSPVGGYHAGRDMALVLDVARFKYPPHWVSAERLWRAMLPIDLATGRPRGWMVLRRRAHGIALGFSLQCAGDSWQVLVRQLRAIVEELRGAADLRAFARAVAPLASHLELRTPTAVAHQQALIAARAALAALPDYPAIVEATGPERAEAVTLLLFAVADLLAPGERVALGTLIDANVDEALAIELANVRAQLTALWKMETPVSPLAG